MAKHKSMRGEAIDLNKLIAQSENSITVGNTKTNAKGDVLGKGGRIVRKAETVAREHYNKSNPKSVTTAGLKGNDILSKQVQDDWEEPTPSDEKTEQPKSQSKIAKKAAPKTDEPKNDGEWVEDADGNFVRKEDANENKTDS